MSTTPQREVWVVKGIVTDPSAYRDQFISRGLPAPVDGDPEYRFFDSYPDAPGGSQSSADYADLAQGLAQHDGCVIHWCGDDPSVTLYDRWESFAKLQISARRGYSDILDQIRDAAYEQGILGPLLDGLDQRP